MVVNQDEGEKMETRFHSAARISAKELADIMGISVRTLTRLDEKGVLVALRNDKGRRVYTTEHIQKALEIMADSAQREVEAEFFKNGAASIYGRVRIPRKWLEKLGITREEPSAWIRFDGESIIITKESRPVGNKERVYFED